MVSSITEYVSYFEAGEDMTNEEYGIYMRAIHNFAYNDIEPDYASLPPLVKAALRTVIASVRKNKEDRENGAKGGRPTRVIEKQKPRLSENKNPGYEKTETNVNENVNDNDKENVNTHKEKKEDLCVPSYIHNPEKPENYDKTLSRDLYEAINQHNSTAAKERKVPISKDFFTFCTKEMREFITARGPQQEGNNTREALQNFLKVASSDTWQKSFSWHSFCNNLENYMPEYFTLSKYLNKEPDTDDATKKPEYLFYTRMRNEAEFDVDLFQNHIQEWTDQGRPEGKEYYNLQRKWEEEKCL